MGKILEGTIRVKLEPAMLEERYEMGVNDVAIIHEVLDGIMVPQSRIKVSFQDCRITDEKPTT